MAGRKHTGNNRLMHEARREVEQRRSSEWLGADPIEALQEVLDGTVADLRHAQERVDNLPVEEAFRATVQGTVPNEWIRLRDHYREELERVANNLVRNGIAERSVRVREAQAVLFVGAVQAAAVEAGIPNDKVRDLGAALRRQLDRSPVASDAAADLAEEPKELPA